MLDTGCQERCFGQTAPGLVLLFWTLGLGSSGQTARPTLLTGYFQKGAETKHELCASSPRRSGSCSNSVLMRPLWSRNTSRSFFLMPPPCEHTALSSQALWVSLARVHVLGARTPKSPFHPQPSSQRGHTTGSLNHGHLESSAEQRLNEHLRKINREQ